VGMVFLEMISNRGPGITALIDSKRIDRPQSRVSFERTCEILARERLTISPIALIQSVAGNRIQPGLMAILAKCLDPDPARRYQRGRDLASDLDRWRTDRPLIFAVEPLHHATYRKVYGARRPLLAVATVLVAAGSVAIGVGWSLNGKTFEILRSKGIEKVANLWDSKEVRAFGFSRIPLAGDRGELSIRPMGLDTAPRSSGLESYRPGAVSKSIEIASLALNDYQVLDSANWREREDVRTLPKDERDDLDLWLMEQAYRYLHDLAEHPESPEDWERALIALNRVMTATPLSPFRRLADRLERQLLGIAQRQEGLGKSVTVPHGLAAEAGEHPMADPSLEQYILGVATECQVSSSDPPFPPPSNAHSGSIDEQILAYYRAVLEVRPNSFWAHYRAAATCGRLGMPLDRSAHLQACLKLRPANPAIHGLLSSSLLMQNRLGDALSESDQAIELDPDHAEYHRTRAFIDANLGRTEQVRQDIHRYEVLSRTIPSELLKTYFRMNPSGKTNSPESLRLNVNHSRAIAGDEAAYDGLPRLRIAYDPDELDTRFNQALAILNKVQDRQMAIAELGKILLINPNYHHARILKAGLLVESRSYEEGRRELKKVLTHPQLNDFIFERPDVVARLIDIAWAFMRHGRKDDSLDLSRRLLDLPDPLQQHVGRVHYTLARAEAASSSPRDQSELNPIVGHLSVAFGRNPTFRDWYKQDPIFDPIRKRVDEAMCAATNRQDKSSALQAALSGTSRDLDD